MIKVQHKSWKQRSCGGSRGVEKQEAHEGYGSEKVVRLLTPRRIWAEVGANSVEGEVAA